MNVDSKVRRLIMRLYDTTEQGKRYYCEFAGPSTAAKPTGWEIVSGSRFIETDTKTEWIYDEELGWRTGNQPVELALGGSYFRVAPLQGSVLASGKVIDVVGIPPYVEDVSQYEAYGLTDTGWYTFARITSEDGSKVGEDTTVTGAAGYIAEAGADHVDVAVRFEVAAMSQVVTINWGTYVDEFVFRAPDLAVRNLDYRTTFYVYDADRFVTWQYALTTDTEFVADKAYYTKDGDVYTKAEVTTGEAVAADTYYNHSKCVISGMARNITYKLDEVIDCPMEFILPVIEDETHGCWFEIRCIHAGEYSMTLTPPSDDVKIGTEHTQKETKGLNTITLHYSYVDDKKVWRFLNTHTTIPD